MNLERANNVRSQELDLSVGTILVNQVEYIVEVLMKLEPSLQLQVKDNSRKPKELCYSDKSEALHLCIITPSPM